MSLTLIVAMGENRVIGRDGALPWRLPADLARFKRLTMGHALLVGRKTWESIGRPLPGRDMIVISRTLEAAPAGTRLARSLDEAIALGGDGELFVAGGGEIYREALPRARRIHLTRVADSPPGDTFFPPFDESAFRLVEDEPHDADAKNPLPHRFQVYEK